VVLDPVLGTTVSGPLVALDALPELRRLLPGCSLVTPNLDEARLLCGGSAPEAIEDLDGMRAAAAALRGLGAPAVLLKGGHLAGDAVDLLDDGKQVIELRAARLPGAAVHGTGCILSSAIAARLATGASLLGAVQGGKQFLWRKLRQTLPLGHGLRYLP
jgi:hydroxymethylpyrimidine kinase/phosphomethylpyrimidine kinase